MCTVPSSEAVNALGPWMCLHLTAVRCGGNKTGSVETVSEADVDVVAHAASFAGLDSVAGAGNLLSASEGLALTLEGFGVAF